ncbi:MAG: response regulator transcription factor [Candidatus Obscuribacterales bacterium]|nr:response regulator transcription factor [Candidatus Obscuribacterales bacterium]
MVNQPRVMLVDDDETIIDTLTFNLKRHGFDVVAFNSGHKALAKLDDVVPALVILDWMLPDLIGPEICKLMRERSLDVPILMLTGRSSPTDIATGLASGADDYLSKPFSAIELVARVQALLRRASKDKPKTSARLEVGVLVLDDDAKTLTKEGKIVELSPKEFSLLKVLMHNAGKTLPTEALLNQVWGRDFSGDVKTVAVHMRWLRQKLEADPKNPQILETVHRSGYRLNKVTAQTVELPSRAGPQELGHGHGHGDAVAVSETIEERN